jgi:group I intron endonuclease
MPYIYKTTNKINGKVYIGQTKKSKEKSSNYIGSGKLLKEAINEFGKENFIKEIIEEIESIDSKIIDEREMYWIDHFNSTNKEIGYNTTKGGSGWSSFGLTRSEDTKRKQSEKRKGISPWNKGKRNPYSEEQIQKMLDNRKIKCGFKQKPKYVWVCPYGSFDKRLDVAKIYNVTPRMITIWCNDDKKPEFRKLKIETNG